MEASEGPEAPRKYPALREFVAEAISGKHTPEDIEKILTLMEQGIGLEERDRALAEKMEGLPANDRVDPVWSRGYEQGLVEGYQAGRKDERDDRKSRRFKKGKRKAQREARKAH
jgi:hypothetical protein